MKGFVRAWSGRFNRLIGPAFYEWLLRMQQSAAEHKFHRWTTLDATTRIGRTAELRNLASDPGRIRLGAHTHIAGELLVFAHGGNLTIGDYCFLGEGSRIWSADKIQIGNRVLISHGVNIHDTVSHPIDAEARHEHFVQILTRGHPKDNELDVKSAPIYIGDDVWIGFGATVLKGVTIGHRAIVGSGSLVSRDIPDGAIAIGHPAKVIGHL